MRNEPIARPHQNTGGGEQVHTLALSLVLVRNLTVRQGRIGQPENLETPDEPVSQDAF